MPEAMKTRQKAETAPMMMNVKSLFGGSNSTKETKNTTYVLAMNMLVS